MERDLADDLDDLICNNFNFINEEGSVQKIAVLVFAAWVCIAICVYLAANFLLQQPSLSPAVQGLGFHEIFQLLLLEYILK